MNRRNQQPFRMPPNESDASGVARRNELRKALWEGIRAKNSPPLEFDTDSKESFIQSNLTAVVASRFFKGSKRLRKKKAQWWLRCRWLLLEMSRVIAKPSPHRYMRVPIGLDLGSLFPPNT